MITSEAIYKETLDYIATQATGLVQEVTSQLLPIDTLTVFSQSQAEYDFLDQLLRSYGEVSKFTHGSTLYVDVRMSIGQQAIELLGVRQPDETRPQVGYADYPVSDFSGMKQSLANSEFVKPMASGNGIELLELRHPKFDVLGYIVGVTRESPNDN